MNHYSISNIIALKIYLLVALLLNIGIIYSQVNSKPIFPQKLSYKIDIVQAKSKEPLDISCLVHFESSHKADAYRFILGEQVKGLAIKNELSGQAVEYKIDNDTLIVMLQPVVLSKRQQLELHYTVTPDSDGTVFLPSAYKWYPFVFSRLSKFDLTIETPSGYEAFSCGSKSQKIKPDSSIINNFVAIQTEALPLVVLAMDKVSKRQGKLNYAFVNVNDSVQNKIISDADSAFSYFTNYFNEAPYRTVDFLCLTRPNFGCGVAYPGFILADPTLPIFSFSLWPAHEIAHQWWGHTLHFDLSSYGVWFLMESLNEYLTQLYIEQRYDMTQLESNLQIFKQNYEESIPENDDKPLNAKLNPAANNNDAILAYNKGPLLWHKFRMSTGLENFNNIVKEFYHTYKSNFAELNDFLAIAEKYDPSSTKMLREALNRVKL